MTAALDLLGWALLRGVCLSVAGVAGTALGLLILGALVFAWITAGRALR